MPIVFICSVPFGGGERLAQSLAAKLGYAYLSREDVVAKANECGIPVGKLEVAMVKKPAVRERLARLKERYLAVATATICEKAARGGPRLLRAGRPLPPSGRVARPARPGDPRARPAPRRPSMSADEALRARRPRISSREIDDDIRAWVHFVHGVDMDDLRRYDFVVNLENMSLENAATALCGIADLPDFKPTPASRRAMEERLLQARARIRLALDERTAEADLTVRSSDGVVTITYMPRQASARAGDSEVLRDLPGCREIRCTVASTNILWIQEEFRPEAGTLSQVSELARRWGAAVELIRYRPAGGEETALARPVPGPPHHAAPTAAWRTTWSRRSLRPSGPSEKRWKCSSTKGGPVAARRSRGAPTGSLAAVNPDISYSLVVLGDVFLDKPSAARTRMARDLANFLARKVKAPVIGTAELSAKLRFGPGQAARVGAALLAVVVIYVAHLPQPGAAPRHARRRLPQGAALGRSGSSSPSSRPLVAGLYGAGGLGASEADPAGVRRVRSASARSDKER